MTKEERKEQQWWRDHFPTPEARAAADKTVDELPPDRPMSTFIDTWVAAYDRAGGVRPKPKD
jgi:hypothetical protein